MSSQSCRAGLLAAFLLVAGLVTTPVLAQRAPEPEPRTRSERSEPRRLESVPPADRARERPVVEEKPVEAKRKITLGGKEIAYTATLGQILLKSADTRAETAEDLKPRALISYIAYTQDGAAPALRPIIFAWNGGPGSASLWLHVGFLGPKRAILTDDGHAPPPPGGLVPNEESLIRIADIVLIDPVGTGFSRAVRGERTAQFFGYRQDVSAVGDFIRAYVTRHGRWASPKFLLGESYGGARVAGLSDHLQSSLGMSLNGVIIVSGAISYQTLVFQSGNDLPYPLFLPSYAATAWYHKRVAAIHRARPLADLLAEVEAFAAGEYQGVLFKGAGATPEERAAVARKLAEYTGLAEGFIEEQGLRIRAPVFFRELLRGDGRTVGRFDGRYTSLANDANAPFPGFDPSMAELASAYRTALELTLREEIGVKGDLPYEAGSSQALMQWDFGARNRFFDSAPDLARAMTYNPRLKLFIAEGLYDLATPYRSVGYTIDHMADGKARLRSRITAKRYEAGHMMYAVASIRKALARDIEAFMAAAGRVD